MTNAPGLPIYRLLRSYCPNEDQWPSKLTFA
jgi:hypothetical protein